MRPVLSLICCTFLFFYSPINAQVSFGRPEKIDDDWRFVLRDEPDARNKEYNDAAWRRLDLPHDWSVEGTLSPGLASCTGYLPGGIGWYRRHLKVSPETKGEKCFIYFEGVYNRSEVFVNGHSIGRRPNGYISFLYDITPYLQYDSDNVIAVRVDHSLSADSRWYTGSGIYRDVYLIHADPVHIDRWGVSYQTRTADTLQALLDAQVNVSNTTPAAIPLTVRVTLLSVAGKTIARETSKMTARQDTVTGSAVVLKVKNPVLWSTERPYLYQLKTEIIRDGKVIDENVQRAGIRTLTFDANKGFALNGEWMKMKGVCIHHDAGCLGSAVPRKVWERRLIQLKELGCNALRMSHNPQAPDVYDLCDELGFLVMDEAFDEWEFPKKKWLQGWNKGTPAWQGNADYFKEWSDTDIRDMVLRDKNHPSIVLWSIGNEVDYPNDPYSHPVLDKGKINQPVMGGYLPDHPPAQRLGTIAARLAADVRAIDRSRPVTAALAGVIMSNETTYPDALDITGYNYTEDRYDEDHKTYPRRVIFGSETSAGMGAWKAVRDQPFIFGQFIWTGIDYLGEARAWPSRGSNSGLLDLGGFEKPGGYFRQALWDTRPVTYIGTYPAPENQQRLSENAWPVWNYTPGEKIRVVCYTNCRQSRLLLNGKPIGEPKDYDDRTGIVFWDLPFEPGKLEVIGFNDNKEVCRYALQTSGRPYTLTASIDTSVLNKDKDLAYIVIQVKDEHGVPVMLSDDEITCRIEGPARLLGMEASDNSDMGNYRDAIQRAWHGRLLAYIQSTGQEGDVKITFTSPWLQPAVAHLVVVTATAAASTH